MSALTQTPILDPSLLQASNLVNPQTTGVPDDAVSRMIDGFHSGQISANDIIDRYGEVAKAGKAAQIEGLHEFISPENIAARREKVASETEKARLEAEEARTEQGLLPQSGELASLKLQQARTGTQYGNGLQNFQQLATFVPGYDGSIPKKPDGTPDYDMAAIEGNHLAALYNQRLIGIDRLKPVKVEEKPGPGGKTLRISYNAYGEDVSPDPGNPTYSMYSRMANQPLEFKFLNPSQASGPGAQITTPTYGVDRGAGNEISPSALEGGADTQSGLPSVAAPTSGASYVPGMGVPTGAGEIPKVEDITNQVRKQKSYENWNGALPFYNAMKTVYQDLSKLTPEQQRSRDMNQKDIELVSNFVKLYDPNAVIREFKFDKVSGSRPVIDSLENIRATVLRNGILTPQQRTELFRTASHAMEGKEQAIRPDLTQAEARAKAAGHDINLVLNPAEQNLAAGQSIVPKIPEQGAPATGKTGTQGTIMRNGQRVPVQLNPDGTVTLL